MGNAFKSLQLIVCIITIKVLKETCSYIVCGSLSGASGRGIPIGSILCSRNDDLLGKAGSFSFFSLKCIYETLEGSTKTMMDTSYQYFLFPGHFSDKNCIPSKVSQFSA